jgi:hypothetical protein
MLIATIVLNLIISNFLGLSFSITLQYFTWVSWEGIDASSTRAFWVFYRTYIDHLSLTKIRCHTFSFNGLYFTSKQTYNAFYTTHLVKIFIFCIREFHWFVQDICQATSVHDIVFSIVYVFDCMDLIILQRNFQWGY